MSSARPPRQVAGLFGVLAVFILAAIALASRGQTSRDSVPEPSASGPTASPSVTQPVSLESATTPLTTTRVTPGSSPLQVGSSSTVTVPGQAETADSTTLVTGTADASTTVTAVLQEPRAAMSSQADEGGWHVLASTGAGPVLWATSVHPLAGQPSVVASYALFDPARLHAALFNGTDLPGGGPWNNGPNVMPAAQSALIGAFNGGFRFKHIKGGYYTESQVVKPLIDGDATLAIDVNGRIALGVYGRDLTNDGTWVSLRQNLPPVIDGGREAVSTATEQGSSFIYWGDDYGHVVLDRRSAICRRSDGLLMYVVTERVDITGLANVLLAAECNFAMELDINGSWPQFVSFAPSPSGPPTPMGLTSAMTHLDRVTNGSSKDFIALFDPALLPAGLVK